MKQITGGFMLMGLVCLSGCATSSLEREVITSDTRVVSEQEAARKVDAEFQKQNLLYEDQAKQAWIQGIVTKLVKASHNQKANFTVRLIKQKEPNAFSVGGQYVYVTSGLIQYVKNDTDMVAGILGHEISHDFAGHSERKGAVEAWKDLAVSLVSNKSAQTAAGLTANLFTLKYSRAYEREADILGTVYAYRAGYDTQGIIRFFDGMSKAGGVPPALSFLSTHPSDPSRINTVNLVTRFLKKELTLDEVAVQDPKVAQTLRAVVALDQRS